MFKHSMAIAAAAALACALSACGGSAGDANTAASTQPATINPTTHEVCAPQHAANTANAAAPFMPSIFQSHKLEPGPVVHIDDCGIPSVIIWSTGEFNQSPTTIAQWGIGAYDRGEYATAIKAANWLLAHQSENGGWPLTFNHTNAPDFAAKGYHLAAPWYSSVTQGNVISLLTRVYTITNDDAYRDAALRGLDILGKSIAEGGLQGSLNGMIWFEETPDPAYPNHIFNGSVFALLAVHDVYQVTGSEAAKSLWDNGEASVRANINEFIVWNAPEDPTLPIPWMIYDKQVNGYPAKPNYVGTLFGGVHIKQLYELYDRTGEAIYRLTAESLGRSYDQYMLGHAQ